MTKRKKAGVKTSSDMADFSPRMATLVHLVRRELAIVVNAHAAANGLRRALLDVFPEKEEAIQKAFLKNYDDELQHGEIAVAARLITGEFDKVFPQGKYGS